MLIPSALLARHRSLSLVDMAVDPSISCPANSPVTFQADLTIHEKSDYAKVVVSIRKKRGRLVRFISGKVRIQEDAGPYPLNLTVSATWNGRDWRGRTQKDGSYVYSARAFLIEKKRRWFRINGISKKKRGRFTVNCADAPPQVTITSPADGLTTDQSQITVTGVATDDQGISQAYLIHNGVSSPLSLDAQGSFLVPVTLAAGLNGIAVSVEDTAGNRAATSVQVTRLLPPAITFSSDPAVIAAGHSAGLIWTTQHANSVVIDQGVGEVPVNGTYSVSPPVTTTYTLTANGDGGTRVAQTTITVHPVPTGNLAAEPLEMPAGGSTTLTWNSENADTVTIGPGIGNVSPTGSMPVSPSATTTYTITATGPGGTASAQVTVTVYPAPTVSFSATPDTIIEGESVTLNWSSEHADTVTIEPGLGEVGPGGRLQCLGADDHRRRIGATDLEQRACRYGDDRARHR